MNINPSELSRCNSLDFFGINRYSTSHRWIQRLKMENFGGVHTNHYPSSSPFYPFVDLIVVVWMIKKHFLPVPDMVSQSSGDCRCAFLLPSALSDRQAHVWSDEIVEHLKEEHLSFKFLFYLRCCQCSPYQRLHNSSICKYTEVKLWFLLLNSCFISSLQCGAILRIHRSTVFSCFPVRRSSDVHS